MFSSDRRFSVYSYSVSHGRLLLRSGKSNKCATRIDILFHDVRGMEIRSWFDGIEITEESPKLLENFASNPSILLELGNKVYSLKGVGWNGYVLGGILRTHEDDGEFFGPSSLL